MSIRIHQEWFTAPIPLYRCGVECLKLTKLDDGKFKWELDKTKKESVVIRTYELRPHELRQEILKLKNLLENNIQGVLLIVNRFDFSDSVNDFGAALLFEEIDEEFIDNYIHYSYEFFSAVSSLNFDAAEKIHDIEVILNS